MRQSSFHPMKIKILAALLVSTLAAAAQLLAPSQIISLYSEVTNMMYFSFKDTMHTTNSVGVYVVPKNKTFMLTDISVNFPAGWDYTETRSIRLFHCTEEQGYPGGPLIPIISTNSIIATFFNFGYSQVNQNFSTPIPIPGGCVIKHDVTGVTNGEIILRGYLTGAP
jgi:hypothetical protein